MCILGEISTLMVVNVHEALKKKDFQTNVEMWRTELKTG